MQVCKANPKRKQVLGEELARYMMVMEHDGTIVTSSKKKLESDSDINSTPVGIVSNSFNE